MDFGHILDSKSYDQVCKYASMQVCMYARKIVGIEKTKLKGTGCDEMNILWPNDSIRFVRHGYKI